MNYNHRYYTLRKESGRRKRKKKTTDVHIQQRVRVDINCAVSLFHVNLLVSFFFFSNLVFNNDRVTYGMKLYDGSALSLFSWFELGY